MTLVSVYPGKRSVNGLLSYSPLHNYYQMDVIGRGNICDQIRWIRFFDHRQGGSSPYDVIGATFVSLHSTPSNSLVFALSLGRPQVNHNYTKMIDDTRIIDKKQFHLVSELRIFESWFFKWRY